jgi:hypothetical protein
MNPTDGATGASTALQRQTEAKKLVLTLAGTDFDDHMIRERPGEVLNALQLARDGENPLSLPAVARAFENTVTVLSEGPDGTTKARDHLAQHMTPELQSEIQERQGDRLTVGLQVVEPEVILAALALDTKDTSDKQSLTMAGFYLLAWADSLREREDWQELLQMQVTKDYTLVQLIVAAAGVSGGTDDLDYLGIDLVDLNIDLDEIPRFTELDVAMAKKHLRELRESYEAESSDASVQEQFQSLQQAATELEDEVDI